MSTQFLGMIFVLAGTFGNSVNAAIEVRGTNIGNEPVVGVVESIGLANTENEAVRVVLNVTPRDSERYGEVVQVLFSGEHYSAGVAASSQVGKCAVIAAGARLQTANLVFRSVCE